MLYDPFNGALSCGASTMDHRDVLVFNYIYDLPLLSKNHEIAGRTFAHGSVTFGVSISRSEDER